MQNQGRFLFLCSFIPIVVSAIGVVLLGCQPTVNKKESSTKDSFSKRIEKSKNNEDPFKDFFDRFFSDKPRTSPWQGTRTLILPDGLKYVGGLRYGKFHGQGTFIWPNGLKYKGEFLNGKPSTTGKYILPNNAIYEGKIQIAAYIVEIIKNDQAKQIGLRKGDIIVEYNDTPITSGVNLLTDLISATSPTDIIALKVHRNKVEKSFTVKGGLLGTALRDYPRIPSNVKKAMDMAPTYGQKIHIKDNMILSGQKWAVVIGVSEYQYSGVNGLENLIYADDDALAFKDMLRKLGWSSDHIKLLINKNATQRKIMIALESWLTKAGPNDQIILFWAGHGFPDPEDPERVYFACYDTDISIPVTGYRMDRVRGALEERKAKNVIILADTCHAGKIITRGNRGVSVVSEIEKMKKDKAVPRGWIFMVGADTDRNAIEHTSWKNGAFTRSLIKGLSGEADGFESVGPKDGSVTMRELRAYLYTVMPDETQKVLGVAKRPVITTSTGDPEIWSLTLKAK
jgi:hypothetical protein